MRKNRRNRRMLTCRESLLILNIAPMEDQSRHPHWRAVWLKSTISIWVSCGAPVLEVGLCAMILRTFLNRQGGDKPDRHKALSLHIQKESLRRPRRRGYQQMRRSLRFRACKQPLLDG